ncbi:hypothetical protein B0H14DRAFT_2182004, partial [Mycena olivaceomarginata]
DALRNEEGTLRDEIHDCEGVISPIRRLPPEIIVEIFLYLTPRGYDEPHLASEIPWHLGHICSYWRTVALSIPLL